MSKRSRAVIPGNPALLYEILTGYDQLGEWMPGIAAGKLLAREGDLVLAELELKDSEACRFSMECVHSRDKLVVWRPIENKIPVVEVRWELGVASPGQCDVSVTVDRRLSMAHLAWLRRRLLKPGECLRALRSHVSLFLPDLALPDAEGEKILEIVETQHGLTCWLRGKKYKLVPVADDQTG